MRQQRVSWFCAVKVNRTIFQTSLFSCPNAHNRFLQIGIYVLLSASNKVEQLLLPFLSVLLPLAQYPCVHFVLPALNAAQHWDPPARDAPDLIQEGLEGVRGVQ